MNNNLFLAIKTESLKKVAQIQKKYIFEKIIFQMHMNNNLFWAIKTEFPKTVRIYLRNNI